MPIECIFIVAQPSLTYTHLNWISPSCPLRPLQSLRNVHIPLFESVPRLKLNQNHKVIVNILYVAPHVLTRRAYMHPAATFLFPSQIIPFTPAQLKEGTPKPRPPSQQAQQLQTPESIVRPMAGRLKGKHLMPTRMPPPPPSPSRSVPPSAPA